jgi:hypothetical protein
MPKLFQSSYFNYSYNIWRFKFIIYFLIMEIKSDYKLPIISRAVINFSYVSRKCSYMLPHLLMRPDRKNYSAMNDFLLPEMVHPSSSPSLFLFFASSRNKHNNHFVSDLLMSFTCQPPAITCSQSVRGNPIQCA